LGKEGLGRGQTEFPAKIIENLSNKPNADESKPRLVLSIEDDDCISR
jgi:hypothetical protein